MRTGGLRGAWILAVFVTLSALLGWGSVQHLAILRMIEQWVGDLRIATLQPLEPQHPEIIVVAITEETLEQFPYRAPIDRKFLSDLLQTLEQRKAKAIFLDILLDQPTEQEKDTALRTTLRQMRIPTVVSYIYGQSFLTDKQTEFLNEFVPVAQRGMANLVKDRFDNTVRWIYPGNDGPDGYLLGVAGLLVKHLGVEPPREQISMDWHGRPDFNTEPFVIYPAHLVPMLPAEWFAGKIMMIGADLSLTDRHRTPFSAVAPIGTGLYQFGTPGVVIHAHAVAQLLRQQDSVALSGTMQSVLMLGAATVGVLWAISTLALVPRLLMALVTTILYWVAGFQIFHQGGPLLPLLAPTLAFVLALASGELYLGREDREQRKFIKNAFSRYLAPTVVEQLLNNRDSLRLGGERREMTFLFTDVADFTTFSEKVDATALTHLLNQYLNGLCQVILRHEGTVINFIGDAVFALFGAPARQADHPARAMACALEMDLFALSFQQQMRQQGIDFGITRIGVHTGYAAIGNMGSEDRFQYTSLGDAVNIAARLEGFNKYIGSRVAVSEETASRCVHLPARPIAAVILKGKTLPITVFEPLTQERATSPAIQRYREAYSLLEMGHPEASMPLFQELANGDTPDPCAVFHLARIEGGAQNTAVRMESK
ncbi:MAG: adenylate/guanylate cyclase domain-containing protein [Magnetococcales bacterium]|nr:adenylate/guanylate cyclase domain-containing protein [Magnetococcales bacterium]MBF0437864.1 adenylate/guanylate cyclase domain-containing protein [Magnetococcales bacterium]